MEAKRNMAYFRAKKKVEILKGFYSHLIVYIIINTGIILVLANVFGKGKTEFYQIEIFLTPFFWGIGLVSHALYVFFVLYVKNNFLRRWEEKKIKQFLDEERF